MHSRKHKKIHAVLLDRDGVINEEVDLLHQKSQLRLLPRAGEAIALLNRNGVKAIVITNQPVVARNLCTEEELNSIHGYLKELLREHRAHLDAIYYCPHHPDKGYLEENPVYKRQCRCRKPGIGMVEDALRDFSLSPEECIMVGDSTVDIETGKRAGMRTLLVRTGYAGKDGKHPAKADLEAADLFDAAKKILLS